jgi:hypothetical protein
MGADEELSNAKYVLKQIKKQHKMVLKRAEVHKVCRSRFMKIEALLPALDLLVEHGYLREIPPDNVPSTGRPPDNRYALIPLFWKAGRPNALYSNSVETPIHTVDEFTNTTDGKAVKKYANDQSPKESTSNRS